MNASLEIINEILRSWLKPYLVCVCDDFESIEILKDRMMHKCKCGGLMSFARLANAGLVQKKD